MLMGHIRPWQPAPLPLPQPPPGAVAAAADRDAAATARADSRDAPRLVALARAALDAGGDSALWGRMRAAWAAARAEVRDQALCDMWSSANRPSPNASVVTPEAAAAAAAGGGAGGAGGASAAAMTATTAPMRYRHQQQLLDLIDEHLTLAAEGGVGPAGGAGGAAGSRTLGAGDGQPMLQATPGRRLSVVLSTPTGSGKTFTAVMLQLHVLRQRQARAQGGGGGGAGASSAPDAGVAEEARIGHPGTILIYSVPTKQVRALASCRGWFPGAWLVVCLVLAVVAVVASSGVGMHLSNFNQQ